MKLSKQIRLLQILAGILFLAGFVYGAIVCVLKNAGDKNHNTLEERIDSDAAWLRMASRRNEGYAVCSACGQHVEWMADHWTSYQNNEKGWMICGICDMHERCWAHATVMDRVRCRLRAMEYYGWEDEKQELVLKATLEER